MNTNPNKMNNKKNDEADLASDSITGKKKIQKEQQLQTNET